MNKQLDKVQFFIKIDKRFNKKKPCKLIEQSQKLIKINFNEKKNNPNMLKI